jgi:hypothetical protein
MTSVTIDAKNAAALTAGGLVAVKTESGQVIGFFAPLAGPDGTAILRRMLPDPEDIRRQKENLGKTYTTDEVRAYLRSLRAG